MTKFTTVTLQSHIETLIGTHPLLVQELAVLKQAQNRLQNDEYFLKVIAYLKKELSSLAVKNLLSPPVMELFTEISRQNPATGTAAIWNFLIPDKKKL